MARPPKKEVIGVALGTGVAAIWFYAVGQWYLAEMAPAAREWSIWPFAMAIAATAGFFGLMRLQQDKKQE